MKNVTSKKVMILNLEKIENVIGKIRQKQF